MAYILEADSIQLSYENRRILGDIYIKCEIGKIVGLLGRNGSGKSSLLKVIFGIQAADIKSVRINGNYCARPYQEDGLIFLLPQYHHFLPNSLTLKKLFELHEVRWDEFIGHFSGFESLISQKPEDLSTGERRLVEVYLGIMNPSKFTFMDEPFAALAPLTIEKIKELIHNESYRKGFLISDQRWEDVWEMSDDLYFLKNGKTYPRKDELKLDDWKAYLAI